MPPRVRDIPRPSPFMNAMRMDRCSEAFSRGWALRMRGARLHPAVLPGTAFLAGAALSACGGVQSTLAPSGPAAGAIAGLYWYLLAASVLVSVVVLVLLGYALLRGREPRGERPPLPLAPQAQQDKARRLGAGTEAEHGSEDQQKGGSDRELTESDNAPLPVIFGTPEEDLQSVRWVLAGGVGVTGVILLGTLFFTFRTLGALSAREPAALTIEVTGHQWWWEVHYLGSEGERRFETANEIHIPIGERVRVRLKSADVIHSFWVPQLAGKVDMIPGRTNQLWIQADEAGVYRGQCAEYCAGPHALMSFLVVAEPLAEYQAWAQRESQDALPPRDPQALRGQEVFLGSECATCHTVRGTPAGADFGPDLTHVASRRTLAAVTIPNSKGHMGGWLANPQELKPGNKMPAVPVGPRDFLALLRYMESLR